MTARSRPRRIRGTVIPHERDRRGRLLSLALQTADGQEYPVANTPLGEMLLDFIDEDIVARCTVHRDQHENIYIKVLGFDSAESDEELARAWVGGGGEEDWT